MPLYLQDEYQFALRTRDHRGRKILVPIYSSECSLYAAKHPVKLAKDQNRQLFCIHVIGNIPYGYQLDGSAIQEYLDSVSDEAESWFDKVRDIAREKDIEPKTETFSDVKSIIESIIDYAAMILI